MTRLPRTVEEIVETMHVADMEGVFVLGCLERRVTVYSQQVRALNLVYGLVGTGHVGPGTRVAVVGGGAAGLTAAGALVTKGARVCLYERADQPMHLQVGCLTRWLHPRIYDWPAPGWESSDARLPICNWKAASADDVTQQIVGGYSLIASNGEATTRCGVRGLEIVASASKGGRWRVIWSDRGTNGDETFDVVILAVGFGVEQHVPFAPRLSYWRLDTLEQTPLDVVADIPTYLVSGTGDGGLIDVLRARLREFRHADLVSQYLDGPGMAAIRKQLLRIEAEATEIAQKDEKEANAHVTRSYYTIETPAWMKRKLATRARDVRVILLGLDPSPLTLRTAIHNRFLVSRTLLIPGVEYRVGQLMSVEPNGYSFRAITRSTVASSEGREDRIDVDRVVVRHGADSALAKAFPAIWHRVRERAAVASPAMPTPLWSDEFYAVASRSKSRAKAAEGRPAPRIAPRHGVRLLARFMKDSDGLPRSFESSGVTHYWILLSVDGAPPETPSVTYELYEDYADPQRTILRGPHFEEKITSYGDFPVTARVGTRTHIRELLSRALAAGHDGGMTPAIKLAIANIRNN